MKKLDNEKRFYIGVSDVERVEFKCATCTDGFYRYNPNKEHAPHYNQLAHTCNKCEALVYLAFPYPALRYKGRIFVDWNTIKGFM